MIHREFPVNHLGLYEKLHQRLNENLALLIISCYFTIQIELTALWRKAFTHLKAMRELSKSEQSIVYHALERTFVTYLQRALLK